MKVLVKGLYYYEGKSGLQVGAQVSLKPDSNNAYDPNAVAVICQNGKILGHINRADAAWLSPCLLQGMEIEAKVHSINKGNRSPESCVLDFKIPTGFRDALAELHSPLIRDKLTSHVSPSIPLHQTALNPRICERVTTRVTTEVNLPDTQLQVRYNTPSDRSCFVATAVFQTPDHCTVAVLRRYRDDCPQWHDHGPGFIDQAGRELHEAEAAFAADRIRHRQNDRPDGNKTHRSGLSVVMIDLPFTEADIPAKPLILDVVATSETPGEGLALWRIK